MIGVNDLYFPSDMNFQYFFFDTYIGYFLQALPIAVLVSILYVLIRFRRDKNTPIVRKVFTGIFVCYMTGLVCLTIGFDLMNISWYKLLYHMDPGRTIGWFNGDVDFTIDFINNISGETIGNFMMFLPFGILYPLKECNPNFKQTVFVGLLTVIFIEILQPIFGRAFDLNDIILNSLGIVASTTLFFILRRVHKSKYQK